MKKKMKWILIVAALAGAGYWYYGSKKQDGATAQPTYEKAVVKTRDIRTTVETTGEVQPRNRLDVKPPIAGRLEELLVDEGDKVEKGRILGWISSTERATLLDAALATSEEELAYWEKLYKPSPLISPLNGTIIARNFEPGQSIAANDAVVVIADDLIVVASLDETDIGQVKVGQRVETRLEAYPDRAFDCQVEKIAYDAKLVSNVTMYEVDARPARVPPFARSGMTANLEFVIEEKKDVVALPVAAILTRTESKDENGAARPDVQNMTPDERKAAMIERMKERGLSDAEIQERLERFAQGGGEGRRGGGGGARKPAANVTSYVLVASDDPDQPNEVVVETGVSDGSHIEILAGLSEGDEVLIRSMSFGSGKKNGNNPFMSGMGRR